MELACKELVFHFNKGHLQDPTIPMWVVKTGGKSYYVHHVTATATWSTKETPDNPSTKGSIKFKNVRLVIDAENNAEISTLTEEDRVRIEAKNRGITRAIFYNKVGTVKETVGRLGIPIGPVKQIGGVCGTTFTVFDVYGSDNWTTLLLSIPEGTGIRELMPNEKYYQLYEKYKYSEQTYICSDDEEEEDEYDLEDHLSTQE